MGERKEERERTGQIENLGRQGKDGAARGERRG